jgi:hypothetical protein
MVRFGACWDELIDIAEAENQFQYDPSDILVEENAA